MIAFGPIPSRRLDLSLGINNIVSHKVCSYSCVYCQIGNTKNKSILSIPTRPPALQEVKPVSEEKTTEAWQIYQEAGITTELLTGFEGTDTGFTGNAFDDILNITAVHPLREDTITNLLKQNKTSLSVINSLAAQELIKSINYKGKTYYVRNYHF